MWININPCRSVSLFTAQYDLALIHIPQVSRREGRRRWWWSENCRDKICKIASCLYGMIMEARLLNDMNEIENNAGSPQQPYVYQPATPPSPTPSLGLLR